LPETPSWLDRNTAPAAAAFLDRLIASIDSVLDSYLWIDSYATDAGHRTACEFCRAGHLEVMNSLADSALTANVLSNVTGTADPCSVFWRVGTSATLNGITFSGIVIADASITVGSGSNVTGKAIAGTGATGAVTMAGSGGNTIGGCASITPPPATGPGIPALDYAGLTMLALLLGGVGVFVMKNRM
jgi:Ice-binding-like/IPTL-CTERM motif